MSSRDHRRGKRRRVDDDDDDDNDFGAQLRRWQKTSASRRADDKSTLTYVTAEDANKVGRACRTSVEHAAAIGQKITNGREFVVDLGNTSTLCAVGKQNLQAIFEKMTLGMADDEVLVSSIKYKRVNRSMLQKQGPSIASRISQPSNQTAPPSSGARPRFGPSSQATPSSAVSQPRFGLGTQAAPPSSGARPRFGPSSQATPSSAVSQPRFGLGTQAAPPSSGARPRFGPSSQATPSSADSQPRFGLGTQPATSPDVSQPRFGNGKPTDKLICCWCDREGHEAKDCMKPSFIGDIGACLLCNESHKYEPCPVWRDGPLGTVVTKKFWEIYWAGRVGKPPARLPFCIYKEARRQAEETNMTVSRFLRRYSHGVVPSHEDVLKWRYSGDNDNLWRTFDYSTMAGPIGLKAGGPGGLFDQIETGTAPDTAYTKELRVEVQNWIKVRNLVPVDTSRDVEMADAPAPARTIVDRVFDLDDPPAPAANTAVDRVFDMDDVQPAPSAAADSETLPIRPKAISGEADTGEAEADAAGSVKMRDWVNALAKEVDEASPSSALQLTNYNEGDVEDAVDYGDEI